MDKKDIEIGAAHTLHIDLGGATLEVSRVGEFAADCPVTIAAAHPADAFGAATAALLARTAGVPVTCINPRGRGASSASTREQTLDEMVDDLEAVRGRLGLPAWVFWGMSGGAWLAQIYARKYPHAIKGLVLESGCACFRARLADPACLLSPLHPSWRATLAERGLIADHPHAEAQSPPPTGAEATDEETEWLDMPGVGSVWRAVGGAARLVAPFPISGEMRAIMPALWAFDGRAALGGIAAPTLVIWGTADPVVPMAHAQALRDGIPHAQWLSVDGGGHVPVSEQRSEIAAAVRRFIDEL
jgi:pimeloyl-ACP methyl ester carboxylesterase